MLARIAPMISLTLVVAALGCPRVPEPLAETQKPVATVQMGDPDVILAENVDDVGESGKKSPPIVEPTLFEKQALPRAEGDTTDDKALAQKMIDGGRGMEAVGTLRIALSTDSAPSTWAQLGDAYIMAGDDDNGEPRPPAAGHEPGGPHRVRRDAAADARAPRRRRRGPRDPRERHHGRRRGPRE